MNTFNEAIICKNCKAEIYNYGICKHCKVVNKWPIMK